MRGQTKYVAALVAIPVLFPVVFLVLIGGSALSSPSDACVPQTPSLGTTASSEMLDAEQRQVAHRVVAAVRAFPATADKPHAAVVALATARQESGLRNLDYGDRDSLGVFQQRPSKGWGTPEQIMDVAHATTSFLERLVDVPGWEYRPVTDVAADVQRPAAEYRGLYERWVPLAQALTREMWTQAVSLLPESSSCPAIGDGSNSPVGPGDPGAIARAQSWVDERVPYSQSSYHTNQYGTYRQDCSGYVSLVWGLATSFTTYTLPSIAHPIAKEDLRSGDIMLRPGHTLIFDKWADAGRSSYWAYEQQRPGRIATHYVIPYPYWPGYGTFTPYRRN